MSLTDTDTDTFRLTALFFTLAVNLSQMVKAGKYGCISQGKITNIRRIRLDNLRIVAYSPGLSEFIVHDSLTNIEQVINMILILL